LELCQAENSEKNSIIQDQNHSKNSWVILNSRKFQLKNTRLEPRKQNKMQERLKKQRELRIKKN
jgi:hypothetical protein